jgi:hypothetical protein
MSLFDTNVVRALYHFGRSVSDLARACRSMGEGAYDRLRAIHLDVSQRFTDKAQALQAGRDRNQLAIYHLDIGKEIPTGDRADAIR